MLSWGDWSPKTTLWALNLILFSDTYSFIQYTLKASPNLVPTWVILGPQGASSDWILKI